jgi:translation initiation factor IF-2
MPKKIFELAKELDIGALDLVEQLKTLGINVRNHMSTITDEEFDLLQKHLKKEEEASAGKAKKVAKKVVKKAVAEKPAAKSAAKPVQKTAKKAADNTKSLPQENKADVSEKDDASLVTAEKKSSSTVIRRKTLPKSKAEEAMEQTENEEQTIVATTEPEQVEADVTFEERPHLGLRIQSRPPAPTPVAPPAPTTSTGYEGKYKVELADPVEYSPAQLGVSGLRVVTAAPIKEKVDEKKKVDESLPKKAKVAGVDDVDIDEALSDEDKDKNSKKRLGGLATMISNKKIVSRSALLNQDRADNELKSYATLSGIGHPLYSTIKRKKSYAGPARQTELTEVKESKRVINLHKGGTIAEIAEKLSVKTKELINDCLKLNLLVRAQDFVGIKLASHIAALYDYRVEDKAFDEKKIIAQSEKDQSKLSPRNPIITIMGHVDHGKTTLLDFIRKAKVASGEAGGITQHIGAYSVTANGKTLTFLDTPGHEAFASMRQRGANVTDIVILVVAADDGVMPQTRESIRFCENAKVPIIIAVNKMDKEGANPDRIKQAMVEFNLTAEDWGGDTQFIPISALKGDGIDNLLEAVAVQAEMMELRADAKGKAKGVVIESKIEQGRGPVATILIQEGTLNKGDSIVVGETYGRARSLMDDKGEQLKSAGPSVPVQILGLAEAPSPGDELNVVVSEREAKKIVENRIAERKALEGVQVKKSVSLEDFFANAGPSEGEKKTLNLIVRSDVQGSYEAIKQAVEALNTSEVEVKVIAGGVGAINDNDVKLASSSSAVILGFNMRPISSARRLAESYGLEIKTYSIIYELINDVKLAIEGMLTPDFDEQFIGRAEVRETFTVPKIGLIAGSSVTDGKIQTGCKIRLLRDGKIVFDGKMSSLKRFKDDAKEVKNGFECGIGLENFNDIKVGDIFEAYMTIERKRSIDDVLKKEAQIVQENSL